MADIAAGRASAGFNRQKNRMLSSVFDALFWHTLRSGSNAGQFPAPTRVVQTPKGKRMATSTATDLNHRVIEALDKLNGGEHAGFRPAHAKGIMFSGVFTPSSQAASLTRATHISRSSTPVTVRLSNFAGVPTVADNDPNTASPRGMAIRFHLAEHVHTDIVAHSHDGFPTRTAGEFAEFLRAAGESGPDAQKPTPIESFLATHPKALEFVQAPKPIPSSFARESFFAVSAFKFTNKDGISRYGRYRIIPAAGNDHLSAGAAAAQSANFLFDEISERIAGGPIEFRLVVQLAESGDPVNDATIHWPKERTELELGTITLNRPVDHQEQEQRQIIFDPIPRVDGIDPSDDPLFGPRADVYLFSGRRRRAAAPKK
jgi:catalase